MGLVLYGAGIKGKKYENILFTYGLKIDGFCDTYFQGKNVECKNGRIYPVFSIEEVIIKEHEVIITMDNYDSRMKVESMLRQNNISITTMEKYLYNQGSIVENNRNYIATYHLTSMQEYFEEAENMLDIFWGESSEFYKMFKKLNTKKIIELACGRGRHVPQYMETAEEIFLVDILPENIEYCKNRFRMKNNISYYANTGNELSALNDSSFTALFTYDAMVHFELIDIFDYLKETYRVLEKKGRALFHHSNNTQDYKITYSTGVHGRNYMSSHIFAYLANRAGLTVIEQKVIDWNGTSKIDCITLVEK